MRRLEDKMDNLDLRDTEDVDQTINYARRKVV